jgi:hypothetical protein
MRHWQTSIRRSSGASRRRFRTRGHTMATLGSGNFFEQIFQIFDESDFIPEEIIDVGDRIVVVHRFVGRGQGSGVPVEV